MNLSNETRNMVARKAILAPMLTTTDIPFRLICKDFKAALTTTEMVSARGIVERSSASYRFAVIDRNERPVAIQILASNADYVSRAIHELLPLRPTLFDLNAGCPSDRVCEAGCGAELLDDPRMLRQVVTAAVKASDIPISVKVRAQGTTAQNSIENIARIVEDSGASLLTVHARGRYMRYSHAADWDIIARAKSAVSIPVAGNGDIFSSADAQAMMRQTGCDAVMVARGCLGTPWIFRDIAEGKDVSITENAPTQRELHTLVSQHIKALAKEFGEIHALPRMRKHLLWYTRWYVDFGVLRKKAFMKDDAQYLLDVIDWFFETCTEQYHSDSMEFQDIEMRFRKRVLFWTIPAGIPAAGAPAMGWETRNAVPFQNETQIIS